MAKLSIKKDDYVMIIAGKDKGKSAKIIGIDAKNGRALIEGKDLTVIKKAVKARKASDKGGIIEQPATIAISNVMPICSSCNKPTRVGRGTENGERVRICKKCGAVLVTKKASGRKGKTAKAEEAAPAETKAKAAVRKRVKAAAEAENTAATQE